MGGCESAEHPKNARTAEVLLLVQISSLVWFRLCRLRVLIDTIVQWNRLVRSCIVGASLFFPNAVTLASCPCALYRGQETMQFFDPTSSVYRPHRC